MCRCLQRPVLVGVQGVPCWWPVVVGHRAPKRRMFVPSFYRIGPAHASRLGGANLLCDALLR